MTERAELPVHMKSTLKGRCDMPISLIVQAGDARHYTAGNGWYPMRLIIASK
jgi:hypothetical protein